MTIFNGTSGDDSLKGGAGDDLFHLELGGEDTAQGGAGNDTFLLGATLDSGDRIDGGDGADVVVLDGDYSAGVTIGATTLVDVETLQLTAGHDYVLALDHPTVSGTLAIDGSALGAGDDMSIDARHLGGGATVSILAGAGDDSLVGGSGDDSFSFGAGFGTGDHVEGGDGRDLLSLDGDYAGLVVTAEMASGIEGVSLAAGHSYQLTLEDGVVGSTDNFFSVSGHNNGRDGSEVDIDASAMTTAVYLTGTIGQDTLIGGAGDDVIDMGADGPDRASGGAGDDLFVVDGRLSADSVLDGGDGYDVLNFYHGYLDGALEATTLTSIEEIDLQTVHFLTMNDGNVAAGATLKVVYDASFPLWFDGGAERDGHFQVKGYSGSDTLIGGRQSDTLGGDIGDDTVIGNGGDDTLNGGQGSDKLVGGAGADMMASGTGLDRYFFLDARDSTKAHPDLILDLKDEDQLYLKPIDANADKAGNQTFKLVDHFTHHAGQLVIAYDAAADRTEVRGDTDGDGKAELVIQIAGDHSDFTNFVL